MHHPVGRLSAACLALAVCLLVLAACGDDDPVDPEPTPAPDDLVTATADSVVITCPGGGQIPIRIGDLPNQPDFSGTTGTVESLQCDFDAFSWNSFLALNAGPGGAEWQDWAESNDIFLAGGASIPPWTATSGPPQHQAPAICPDGGGMALQQIAKIPDLLTENTEPFDSGPLVDVNGYYSRFAIFVNQDMYSYIQSNTLYSQSGQDLFLQASTVDFPCGCDFGGDPTTCPQSGVKGAVMIKTAWRILTDADDPSRFHTMESSVFTPDVDGNPATCTSQLVGLVGFHIAHKTQGAPQWIWSTFEHVDNVPTEGQPVDPNRNYSYFSQDCEDCPPVNTPPPQPWNPHLEPVGEADRSQVMRAIALDQATLDMNAAVQPLIAGTVWANYELISTQWPFDANPTSGGTPASSATNWCTELNQTDKAGAPRPLFLANTTLETYIQGTTPQASSSCINCHLNATTAVTVGTSNFSDFTYLLERAK